MIKWILLEHTSGQFQIFYTDEHTFVQSELDRSIVEFANHICQKEKMSFDGLDVEVYGPISENGKPVNINVEPIIEWCQGY